MGCGILKLNAKANSFTILFVLTILMDFSKMCSMLPCLLKKEFIERKLTFSQWLGLSLATVAISVWPSDALRAASGVCSCPFPSQAPGTAVLSCVPVFASDRFFSPLRADCQWSITSVPFPPRSCSWTPGIQVLCVLKLPIWLGSEHLGLDPQENKNTGTVGLCSVIQLFLLLQSLDPGSPRLIVS